MKLPHFIGIVGHKKSGKTTLIESLTAELTGRGYIIGTIKVTAHDLQFDTPGKDTHRHRTAGSRVTAIKSKSEIAVFADADYLDRQMTGAIFAGCDFVFIEGDGGSANPKIYVSDSRAARDDIAGDIIAVWGLRNESLNASHFDSDQIGKLCDYIINRGDHD